MNLNSFESDPDEVTLDAFGKPHCPRCRQTARSLERLARSHRVSVFDIFENKLEAELAGVTESPTFIVRVGGREVFRTHNILELL